jgi:hypothetical protein
MADILIIELQWLFMPCGALGPGLYMAPPHGALIPIKASLSALLCICASLPEGGFCFWGYILAQQPTKIK